MTGDLTEELTGELTGRLAETAEWAIGSPLVWLFATVAVYALSSRLSERTGHPVLQPVLLTVAVMGAAVLVTGVAPEEYAGHTGVLTLLLGPATVAFAVPLHRQVARLRGMVVPMVAALLAGATVAAGSGYLLVSWLGGSEELAASMAPKTATTPVAIAVAETVGGIAALSAVFAVGVGILGAVLAPWVLDRLRVRDRRVRGVAMGVVSHGIGTSRSLREDELEGAVAGLATGLTALAVSVIVPILVALLG